MKKQKIVYYEDEANEEFSGIKRKTISIGGNYKYIKTNPFWNLFAFFAYRIIMVPFAFLYNKIKFRHKVINKNVLKMAKGSGYFMYANHTLMGGDAFIPNMINMPRKTYTVVHPDNLSIKGLKWFFEMNGAFPTPTDTKAMRNFLEAMEKRILEKAVIQIYPEAHIWPYYTKIRPFKNTSFRYPVKFGEPTFCFTNTFHKRKFSKKPKVISYIDGPFYPDPTLSAKEQENQLRDMVYNAMSKRAELNTYEYVKYLKKENNQPKGEKCND